MPKLSYMGLVCVLPDLLLSQKFILIYSTDSYCHTRGWHIPSLIWYEMLIFQANIMPGIQDFLVKGLKRYLSKQYSNICTPNHDYLTKKLDSHLKIRQERILTEIVSEELVEFQHTYTSEMELNNRKQMGCSTYQHYLEHNTSSLDAQK